MPFKINLEFQKGCDKRQEFDRREIDTFSLWANEVKNGADPIQMAKNVGDSDLKKVGDSQGGGVYQFRVSQAKRVIFRLDPGNVCTITHAGIHL
mmetsp:Transcript_11694/g.30779  ORF Transcript_11694/g.30779 Transcript_11694/m.30779 type:complete len:94 (+) Transcript_11694:51-332(+)